MMLLGILFTLLNWQIPRVIDDYPYSRSFVGVQSMADDQNVDATINNLADLINSQIAHYQAINGRGLVHTVVQMFCCWFEQIPFDILQGIFFMICIVMFAKHTGSKNKLAGIPVMLLFMLLFREPACIYHGVACGVNYLWSITITLWIRWLYLKNHTHTIPLGLFAFVAGFSNEALAIPFTGAFFIEMLLQWKECTLRQHIMVVCMCLGTIILIVAPANFHRLSNVDEVVSASSLPLHLQPILNFRLTAICLLFGCITLFAKNRSFAKENQFWIITIVLSVLMSLAIGGENIRQCIAAEVCSAILIVKMARECLNPNIHNTLLVGSASILVLLFIGINIIQRPMSERFEAAKEYVEKSKKKKVVIPTTDISYPPQIEKYRCCELSEFQLEQFRWWYGKESVELSFE